MADNLLTRLFKRDATVNTTERTGKQIPPNSAIGGLAILQNVDSDIPKPAPGTYKTYREMRTNPTVALARMMARAPIQSAKWSVESEDEDLQEFVRGRPPGTCLVHPSNPCDSFGYLVILVEGIEEGSP